MSGESVSSGEFSRFATNVERLLEKLADQQEIFNQHIITNDHRHEKANTRMTSQAEEYQRKIKKLNEKHDELRMDYELTVSEIKNQLDVVIRMLNKRKPFWKFITKTGYFGKLVIGTILLGVLTAAGTGIYNFVTKTETPEIKHVKEGKK